MKTYLYIILLCFLASCGAETTTDTATEQTNTVAESNFVNMTDAQFKNAGIQVISPVEKIVSNTLKINGMIEVPPQNLVSISIPIGGFVKVQPEILQGTYVKQGQMLSVIENPDFIQFQQDYLDTQSKLEYTAADYKRQTEMREENVNSIKVLQQVTSDYKSLQTRLKSLEQYLKTIGISVAEVKKGNITSNITVSSPINGYVTVVNVNAGKHISPAEVMFEIVNTDHLHADLNVFEKDLPKIKVGQKVRFQLNNDNEEFEGSIYLINHKINEDRTVNVHVHFDDKGKTVLPKTFLKAYIETANQAVTALPDDAFIFSEGKDYIFSYLGKVQNKDEQTFEMIEVKKGASENGFTEVIPVENREIKDLKIVSKGAFTLMAKMKNIGEEE
ncbi:MAG: efflux RND transporter periplasmic adaptor subunit [Cytophagales bacterium]|nr:MAG: efflux RND transporter periplasmic adaptor subunit [Cytophagales bacterium]